MDLPTKNMLGSPYDLGSPSSPKVTLPETKLGNGPRRKNSSIPTNPVVFFEVRSFQIVFREGTKIHHGGLQKIPDFQIHDGLFDVPSRKITYLNTGKVKSFSKVPLDGLC